MLKAKSTQMPLRVPSELHRALKMAAANENMSLNQYCLYLLARHAAKQEELLSKRGEDLLLFLQEASAMQAQLDDQRPAHSKASHPQETPLQRWERLNEGY